MTDLLSTLPLQLKQRLWRDPRMRRRLSARLLPDAVHLSGDDRRVLAELTLDHPRLRRLAGLVWHGRRIAQSITREAAAPLAQAFTPAEIAFALDLKLFAPANTGPLPLPAAAVEARGAALLQIWSQNLGPAVAALLDRQQLVTPAADADTPPHMAAILLQAVAYRLEQTCERTAA